MTKKILLTASILLAFCITAATAQVNIGYMNTNKVLSQLPKTQEIQQTLNQLIQNKQTELQKKATAFQDALADYQANQNSMSATEATQTEKKLQQLNRELKTFNQQIKQEIKQRRNQLLLPVLEAIDNAIASVAETKGIDLVINKTTNAGATIIFYASDAQTDITDAVLQKAQTIIE